MAVLNPGLLVGWSPYYILRNISYYYIQPGKLTAFWSLCCVHNNDENLLSIT